MSTAEAPLRGRVALVTGASRGLGKQIALELGRQGAAVAVVARTETPGKVPGTIHETAAAITAAGGTALPVRADLTDDDDIAAAVARTVERLGPVDLLVNNAGVILTKPLLETAPRHLDLMYRINVRAPFVLTQAVVPGMIGVGRGHIVNIATLSSQARGTAVPLGYAGYTGTKAALVRMTLAIALELGPHGVSVNALAPPGLIETEWIAAQEPRALTGRFLETQALLEAAGLIDHADHTYADLPQVDAASIGREPGPG